jgi:hypothetical protein
MRGLRVATLRATRQGVYSPASERAASKLAKPMPRRNENVRQSATSSFDISEMNWRIVLFYHKLLTSRINYTERVYKQDSTLDSTSTSLARIY